MKRLTTAVLLAVVLAGCGGGSDEDGGGSASSLPPCSSIKVGAQVDAGFYTADGSGCTEASGSVAVFLGAICPDQSRFSTYDVPGDQLFSYAGKWHSTKREAALYKRAFADCK